MGIQVWGGEWYECPAIDPVFTKQEWEEAYAVYTGQQNRKIPHKYFNLTYLLKGVLYCSECGELMIPWCKVNKYTKQDGTVSVYEYQAYQCKGRWEHFNGCQSNRHNRDFIENAALVLIEDMISDMDVHKLYQQLIQQIREGMKGYNIQVNQLQNEIKALQKNADKYLDAYLEAEKNSIIRKSLEAKFEAANKELEEKKSKLDNLLLTPPEHNVDQSKVAALFEGMTKWAGIMSNPQISREVKRRLVLDVIDRIDVNNIGRLDIKFKINKDFPRDTTIILENACV